MGIFPVRRLHELCEVTSSKRIYARELTTSGIPFYRSTDIIEFVNGQEFPTSPLFISEERFQEILNMTGAPERGDVLLTSRGTLGVPYLVKKSCSFHFADGNLTWFRKFHHLDSSYLVYYFLSPEGKAELAKCVIGSSQAAYTIASLKNIEIRVPPLSTQRRIAGILSAYDELIENSQRRIQILETMARTLYREWFVHFRFPGHEGSRRVSSPLGKIPEGWETTGISEVCVDNNGIQTGPFGSQLHESDYVEDGVPVVMPKDLIGFRIRTDSIAYISEETANKLARHRMQLGDIVYGRRGDIGRRAYVMSHQAGWFCGTGCLRIRPNPSAINGWYLFNYLGQDDVVGLIAGRAHGVTMPNLNTGIMASVPVVIPPRSVQDQFALLTFPMAEEREALTAKIQNLRRTRDLLLPRLLSGQVNLEAHAA
jgi:type I restriction enzyme S subunit